MQPGSRAVCTGVCVELHHVSGLQVDLGQVVHAV